MHGCKGAVAVFTALAALLVPANSFAEPMPAGTYDVTTNGGSIQLGSFLPPVPIPATAATPVVLGADAVVFSLPTNTTASGNFNTPITGGSLSVNYSITVPSATLTITPSTGSAQLDMTAYGSFALSATIFGIPSSTTCTVGSANAPVAIHPTTSAGAPWAALTGNFGLADNTFVMPAPSCGDANLQAIIGLLMGGTSPGDNSAQVTGKATRQPDAPATTTQTPAPVTTPTDGTPTPQVGAPPTTPAAAAQRCVVPKLVNKTLGQAKRALKKAHCRLGKTKRLKSKKTQKGKKKTVVVKQRTKPGKQLPAGTRIRLVVAAH